MSAHGRATGERMCDLHSVTLGTMILFLTISLPWLGHMPMR